MLKSSSVLFSSVALFALSACGGGDRDLTPTPEPEAPGGVQTERGLSGENILTLFNRPKTENTVQVNKYLWNASLEVLNFLPVQTIDPFTGVIVTGFGTPPGGGRSYRATILIDDPALDARSLNIALNTKAGAANAATVRAIEDAILTRARQLRITDSRL